MLNEVKVDMKTTTGNIMWCVRVNTDKWK